MLSVFFILCFLCLVRCLLPFFCRSSPLRVVFWKNFRERTFVFGCWCWSCVFWWVFAYVFALFLAVRSRNCLEKILLMSGLLFFGFFLSSFGFFADVVVFVFFFKRQRSGSNRTPPHTHLFFWFFLLFLCPAAFVCFARFGRASRFLAFFRGAILGPGRFWDSPGTCSEAPFSWDARRQGCSVLLLLGFFFSPSVLFCGHTFSRCPSR